MTEQFITSIIKLGKFRKIRGFSNQIEKNLEVIKVRNHDISHLLKNSSKFIDTE